ncbi:hypothetical protein P9112_005946 [Eukaryota sp. TZLM1-RC]
MVLQLFHLLLFTSVLGFNVHLVPHSHIDHGWLHTIDYYQSKAFTILDSVFASLLDDANRTFTWSETYYFHKWFLNLNTSSQATFKLLLSNEQFTMVHGGLVSSDEATTTLEGTFLQFHNGFNLLTELNISHAPVLFNIDSFGHSQHHLYAACQLGFKYALLNRIHYDQKSFIFDSHEGVFNWFHDDDCSLIAHLLDNHYRSPEGFDFEKEEIEELSTINIWERSQKLVSDLFNRSANYCQNFDNCEILILIGDDFRFLNSSIQFTNWDKLISFINYHYQNISVFYSNPSNYFNSILEKKKSISRYSTNFLPYADSKYSYWTGFYSTKPYLKYIIRKLESFTLLLQFDKVTQLYSKVYSKVYSRVLETTCLLQHHDSITATSKQEVLNDYVDRAEQSLLLINQSDYFERLPNFLTVKNPGNRLIKSFSFSIPVIHPPFALINSKNNSVPYVLIPSSKCPDLDVSCPSKFVDVTVYHTIRGSSRVTFRVVDEEKSQYRKRFAMVNVFLKQKNSTFIDHFNDLKRTYLPRILSFSNYIDIPEVIETGNLTIKSNGMIEKFKNEQFSTNFFILPAGRSGSYVFNPIPTALLIRFDVEMVILSESSFGSTVAFFTSLGSVIKYSQRFQENSFFDLSFLIFPPDNTEVFLRVAPSFSNSNGFYHNSLQYLPTDSNQREPYPSRIFPAVTSAALTSPDSHVIVDIFHSMGAHFGAGFLDLLVSRHSENDDYKGLNEGNLSRDVFNYDLIISILTGKLDHCRQPVKFPFVLGSDSFLPEIRFNLDQNDRVLSFSDRGAVVEVELLKCSYFDGNLRHLYATKLISKWSLNFPL